MSLSTARIESLAIVGIVHDIGKVFIPLRSLNKSGAMDPAETALIQAHPRLFHYILKDLDFAQTVAEIIVQHHERLNGSGYPAGLADEEILLEARILAASEYGGSRSLYPAPSGEPRD